MKHTMSCPIWLWSTIIFYLQFVTFLKPLKHPDICPSESYSTPSTTSPPPPLPAQTPRPVRPTPPPTPSSLHYTSSSPALTTKHSSHTPRHYSQYHAICIFAIVYPPPSPSPSPPRRILSTGRFSHRTKYSLVKRIETSSIDGIKYFVSR